MITCTDHPDRPAASVFKAHAPNWDKAEYVGANIEIAHRYNVFCCEECSGSPVVGDYDGVLMYERYTPIVIETKGGYSSLVPDGYNFLYSIGGEHIWIHPAAKIYRVSLEVE